VTSDSYLQWLASQTATAWWHDSADPEELAFGKEHGAVGVTTNPVLAARALQSRPQFWADTLRDPEDGVEGLLRGVVLSAARMFADIYQRTQGAHGYVCSQVNPGKASEREEMMAMAGRFHSWAENVSVKLPATLAGLDVLEECASRGICVTSTVSFTVPQVVAAAERYRTGLRRAQAAGITPAPCFAVIMIGRLDDYLRDVIRDGNSGVDPADVVKAGLAVVKRAYRIFRQRGYEARLLIAAMRGAYHVVELSGGELVLSIHPKIQALLLEQGVPREAFIERPIEEAAIERLCELPEFQRAYQPEGMRPEEFITFGATQRTLSQFGETGWSALEKLQQSARR
jgi:transaldolase